MITGVGEPSAGERLLPYSSGTAPAIRRLPRYPRCSTLLGRRDRRHTACWGEAVLPLLYRLVDPEHWWLSACECKWRGDGRIPRLVAGVLGEERRLDQRCDFRCTSGTSHH